MHRSLRSLARRVAAAGAASAIALTVFNAAQPTLGGHRIDPGVVKDVKLALAPEPPPATPRAATAEQARTQAATAEPQPDAAGPQPPGGALVSRPVSVGKARFVGFSWPRPAGVAASGEDEHGAVWLRTRTTAGWSAWREVEPAEDGPDPTSPEYHPGRVYSDGHWLGQGTNELQVRVERQRANAATEAGPAGDLAAHLVTPDMTTTPGTEPVRPNQAIAMTSQPAIISRARWRASESLRRAAPTYSSTVKAAFVHHTVQSNSYSPSESAALVRADYLYHVQSRGWNDIGYNFLVDRFGQVFEGRYGGVTRPVLGAHAGGFNTNTTGIALLGTFTTSQPPSAMVAALQRLLAWKLDLTHVDPLGATVLTSAGGASARYPAGQQVRVPAVLGHRTTSYTTCPGDPVIALLPATRSAASRIGRPKIYGGSLSGGSISPERGGTLSLSARFSSTARWDISVTASNGAVVRRWQGLGSTASIRWDGRGQRGGLPAAGWASVRVTARVGTASARPRVSDVYIRRSGIPLGGTTTGGFSSGSWTLANRNVDQEVPRAFARATYGRQRGDIPIVGDWDGNGTQTIGIIRGNEFHLRNANSAGNPNVPRFHFARPGDRFVVGDWDGDGTWTPGVVRGGVWYLRNANSGGSASITPFRFGSAGDRFVVGDWDGDGTSTPGVLRAGARWYLANNAGGGGYVGLRKQAPGTGVVGDWDGRP